MNNRRMNSRPLCVEQFESRRLLTGNDFGVIWGGDARLTLSFAPDGTEIGAETSGLMAKFDALATRQQWQDAILRGFQTWAVETNADVGLVADDGSDFGVNGGIRQDPRFGDIRIGAIPMGNPSTNGNYAVAVSAAELVDGTWVGEVLFNTQAEFADVDEVFAVAVHEAGHVFGLDDNGNPASPMHSHGIPTFVTPTTEDINALHAIYGQRADDIYDRLGEEPVDLRDFEDANGLDGGAPTIVFGDITHPADRDTYELEITDGYFGPVTVELVTSGISQLAHRIVMPGATPTVNEAAAGTDSQLLIPQASSGQRFMITVEAAPGASDFHNVGGFSLVIWYDHRTTVLNEDVQQLIRVPIRQIDQKEIEDYFTDGGLFVNDDLGANDLPGFETELEPIPAFVEGTRYIVTASIESAGDVDRYRFETPTTIPAESNSLNTRILVRSLSPFTPTQEVVVMDRMRNLVATEILVNNDFKVFQFPVDPGAEYFLKVDAGAVIPQATGSYEIDITVRGAPIIRNQLTTRTLRHEAASETHQLRIYSPSLFQIGLEVGAGPEGARLELQLLNRFGDVMARLAVDESNTRTTTILLPRGGYRVRVSGGNGSTPFQDLGYTIFGGSVERPLGPQFHDPTEEPFRFLETRIQLAIAGIFH